MGWEYSLVDGGWEKMKNGANIENLVTYAHKKNVGIFVWYPAGVRKKHNKLIFNDESRRKEFERISKMGVKGVKIDFFLSDKPKTMNLYHNILEDAMKYRLMVNFHGCTMPRGWKRTYPHLLTMEAVRGAEMYQFKEEYPKDVTSFNTIIPVIRNVVGSMDYTPVLFSERKYPQLTSYAHELALCVLFESGMQHFSDNYDVYRQLPKAPKSLLANIPVAWDETHYMTGYPGKEMVLARRKGNVWYVAGVNGEDISKKIDMKFDFLPEGEYTAQLICDGKDNKTFKTELIKGDTSKAQSISVMPYGGFVMMFRDGQ
jgi:hypothetical protein